VTGRALIVVPTYNERDSLRQVVERLCRLPVAADVLVVDDDSPDGTGALADGLAALHSQLTVLHRPRKEGLGRAYVAGFHWALERGYEFIVEMDGDMSHDPDDVPRLLAAATAADLVLGTRYGSGFRVVNWPLWRLVLSVGAGVYVRMVTGLPLSDPTSGFRCYRRQALLAEDLATVRSNGYSFQIEMAHRLWRQGLTIAEVPIVFTERAQGASKMSPAIVLEALWMVWRLHLQNGLRRRPTLKAQ
jgi:dolichol-phosphate mannosyltransferase